MPNKNEYTILPTSPFSCTSHELIKEHDPSHPSLPPHRSFPHALTYTLLILLNLFLLLLLHLHKPDPLLTPPCIRPQLTYSPFATYNLTHYIRKRLFRRLEQNPFTGLPRPEHDAAWRMLIEPMTIRLTASEYAAADLGDTTLALADGSGVVSELAVYHELHCIKRLRRHLHLHHYYPNMTADERHREDVHIGISPLDSSLHPPLPGY